jgi:uncharacterized protein YbbC (DUF1343 family)
MTSRTHFCFCLALLSLAHWLLPTASAQAPSRRLAVISPDAAGFDATRLAQVDTAIQKALDEKKMPGCVVLIGRQGKVAYLKAFGSKRHLPSVEPMTTDTIFDLASLTKPIATATSVMRLVEEGKVRLRDPVATHLTEFAVNGKEKITVEQLLTHQGGLIADNPISDYAPGTEIAVDKLMAIGLSNPPGTKFVYSDVGFMVLGELVKRVSGKPIHEYAREKIFEPLGMSETSYLPNEPLRSRAAPTEQRDGKWMQGEVHDPRAFALGGVAGHAGLFSTAEDLALYADMMLMRGAAPKGRVLGEATVNQMTTRHPVSSGYRGLGWDMQTGYSANKGETMSSSAFGHGGFTGTGIWIDPELDLFVIFLSNRIHPNGKGLVNPLIGTIGTIAASSLIESGTVNGIASTKVLCGIDVLERESFKRLEGRKVGLITNHTGITREASTTIQAFHRAKNLELKTLFSPEHGIAGALDQSNISDSRDRDTGLPIYSLYGESRSPSEKSLEGIDTLVFDIQDIGCRFYTYVSTMKLAMEAAATRKIKFVVLDRPNPLGGVIVEGPVLDEGAESFVAYHAVPIRHGMTVGELAKMLNEECKIGADLEIVPIEGWNRAAYFDQCGLTWINPSPNMRSVNAALLYPGVGLWEMTNLSVGRGTDTPFEVIGAPWINGPELAAALNGAGLAGVSFIAREFTPSVSKFKGEKCGGVAIIITNRARVHPVDIGIEIAHKLKSLYGEKWHTKELNRLLGSQKTANALLQGFTLEEIKAAYAKEAKKFADRRAKFLLYP